MRKIFYSLIILGLTSLFFMPFTSYSSSVHFGITDCDGTQELHNLEHSFNLKQPMKPFEAFAIIDDICIYKEKQSMNIFISAVYFRNGEMTIKIPRQELNPLTSSCDDDVFQIERSGKFTPYEEIKTVDFREITFPIMSNDYQITISAENPENTKLCDEMSIDNEITKKEIKSLPPLKQINNGISPSKVQCKESLELIFKLTDNTPACVKKSTAEKLIQRGWANPTIKIISELNTNLEKDYRETGSVDNVIGIRGIIFDNGTSILDPWYKFEDKPDVDINNSGEIIVLYLDSNQNIIAQTRFDLDRGFDHIVTTFDFGSFALRIPAVDEMDQIILQRDGQTVATRQISPNDPTVTLLTPNGGELFIQGDIIDVTWQSSDLDGDEIFHILEFSQNGGLNWLTLAIDLVGNQYNFTAPQNIQSDSMLIRVIAIDGINTSEDISDSFFAISG